MPKIRGLSPDFWTDDAVVSMQPFARLLFQGLWNFACDNGHIQDKPAQIKMRVLPADNVDADVLLDEIAAADGLIVREGGWITVLALKRRNRIDRRYFVTCDHADCRSPETDTDRSGARLGNHKRWHVERGVVKDGCEFCQAAGADDPVVDTTGDDPSETVVPSGTRRGHDEAPSGTRRGHFPDGDGDGDGDGDNHSSSGGDATAAQSAATPQRGRASAGKRAASRLPEDWEPSQAVRDQMARERPDVNLYAEHLKFCDYWQAKPGRDATKIDWEKTWRNWIRNARGADRERANGHSGIDLDAAMARAQARELQKGLNP